MIPIADTVISKNASSYVLDCLKSGWVSSKGPIVSKFEKEFAKFIGVKYGVAVSSGTAAVHLALVGLGVKEGDEVIVPALTMIAAVLPVVYVGAKPVLVDAERKTGNLDVLKVKEKISKKTKAIICVHTNGHSVEMRPLVKLARKYNLKIVEDACESVGGEYLGKKVGGIGDVGCFSFYGNKIVFCGEGGMVITNNKKLAGEMRSLRNYARNKDRHFLHEEIGYSYRLSAMNAALGVAQLEESEKFINRKREIAKLYDKYLKGVKGVELPLEMPYAKSVYWQYGIVLPSVKRNLLLQKYLGTKGIETRPFVVPIHKQPALIKMGLFKGEHYPVAEELSGRGLCLPSGLSITNEEILYVSKSIIDFQKKSK